MNRQVTAAVGALAIAVAVSQGIPAATYAAETDDRKLPFETTVFGGYRTGGTFDETTVTSAGSTVVADAKLKQGVSYGIALNWESEADSFYELLYSQQHTNLEATAPFGVRTEYLHFGGYTTFAERHARVIPYGLITIGVARFSPDVSDLTAETKPSAAIGGGVKVPLTPKMALRFDLRFYATFFQAQTDLFCKKGSEATCRVHLQAGTVWQPDAAVGFTFGF